MYRVNFKDNPINLCVFVLPATLLRHRCEYFPEPLSKTYNVSYEDSNAFTKEELNINVKEELNEDPSDIVCDTSNIQYDTNQFHQNYENAVGSISGFSALQLQTLANYGAQKSVELGSPDLLSKEEVEMRFKNGDPELTFERPTNSRHSDTWHRFEIVYYKQHRQNFAKCMECNSFVSYKKTTGTASLIRHKCRKSAMEVVPDSLVDLLRVKITRTSTPTSITITNVSTSSQSTSVPAAERKMQQKFISETIFSILIEKQIKFMSKGLYSTEILTDPNFLALAQNLLEIGAHYGNQNVENLLNKKTICEDVIPRLVNLTQQHLRESLKQVDFTVSYKTWEDCERNEYLTIFCYFLDEDFTYKNVVLATKIVGSDESISSVVQSVCRDDYGFSGKKLKCISNIPIDCDENFQTFRCMVSCFSEIISDSFVGHEFYFKSVYDAILERVGGGKAFETSSINEKLKIFFKFSQIVKENPEKSDKLLDCFNKYFGTIFSAISSVQNCQKITISEIFLWFRRFLNIYSGNSFSEIPESLRKEVEIAVKRKQDVLKDFHRIAVFLDPNFKNLKFLDQNERSKLLDTIKQQLQEVIGESQAPSSKKIKLDRKSECESGSYAANETFLEFMDISMENDEDLATAEIQRYMGFKLENPTNLTEFWRTTDNFPHLKTLARNLLNVPSCSFHNDCCFLSCESPIYSRSRNLMPEEIENLTFLHQNL